MVQPGKIFKCCISLGDLQTMLRISMTIPKRLLSKLVYNFAVTRYTIIKRRSVPIPHNLSSCCLVEETSENSSGQTQLSLYNLSHDNSDLSESFDIDADFNMSEMELFDGVSSMEDRFGGFDTDPFDMDSPVLSASSSMEPLLLFQSRAATVDGESSLISPSYLPTPSQDNPEVPNTSELGLPGKACPQPDMLVPCRSAEQSHFSKCNFMADSGQGSSSHISNSSANHTVSHNELEDTTTIGVAESLSARRSRTTIVMDDVQPNTLVAVMDLLIKSKAKVRFETE